MKSIHILVVSVLLLMLPLATYSQVDTITYHLFIKEEMVNHAGKQVRGMTINGSIPGPELRFVEGGYAVIYVKNEMSVETSVHWHGILLPNYFDGVPYLTTPPIKPGTTFKYEFPLKQSGTYWYHSHTMLQEQSGVFGALIIEPREPNPKLKYDNELVLMLSDWTNQKPMNVLRNLKRGNEWYNIKKGTTTPLNRVIARGAFGAQLNFWKQRMEGMDIADIYYPAFLSNGRQTQEYPQFKPGDKVRLRIINGSASSQFWLTFGGEDPLLVSSDGLDVVPVKHNKTFIAIAETYDFIVTIPKDGKIELRAMAQDGSGITAVLLGQGEVLKAPIVPKPDQIGMMKQMAKMKMRMGAPALKFKPKDEDAHKMKANWGMKMDDHSAMQEMDHAKMGREKMEDAAAVKMNMEKDSSQMDIKAMDHNIHNMEADQKMEEMNMNADSDQPMSDMQGMNMFAEYNYDYLRSPARTTYADDIPVKEILLNLTGNMQRYIWSMNGVALSETDNIKIKHNEVTRITLNNLTMMHHPMHLHGHFFRVINKNGDYSPLKHTVNVPPMQQVTIEFYGDEYGDWFFHCHVLYHMMGGMARVFSYGTPRDARLEGSPVSKLIHETNQYYA